MNHLITSPWRYALLTLLTAVVTPIAFPGTAKAEPAMWVIRDKDSTIYLIGTLHLLRHETEWNATKVRKAVTESSDLWLEVADIDNQAAIAPIVAQYGIDSEKTLSSRLSAAQNEKLAKLADEYGLPPTTLESMKPWLAAMMFAMLPLQKAGYDPNAGVDRLLKTQADKEGDKVRGFETAEQQVRFLAELSESEQIAFLDGVLGDAEKGMAQLEKLAKAWVEGDSATIAAVMVNEVKQESPVIYDRLLVRRNIAWSEKVAEILKGSGVHQIAVGAGHLVGPDSLQVQLAKRGIKSERY